MEQDCYNYFLRKNFSGVALCNSVNMLYLHTLHPWSAVHIHLCLVGFVRLVMQGQCHYGNKQGQKSCTSRHHVSARHKSLSLNGYGQFDFSNLISLTTVLYDNTVVRKDFKYATSRLQTCTCASIRNVDSYTRTRCWNTGCRVNGEACLVRHLQDMHMSIMTF